MKTLKEKIEEILYKNYEPTKGLGADEIDMAINQILELLAEEKQKWVEEIREEVIEMVENWIKPSAKTKEGKLQNSILEGFKSYILNHDFRRIKIKN
jgi:ribonucleotide reductase beta subunit family protein with ferritin-like domain